MPIQFITPSIISSVANTQVTGTITASQLATSLNLATNNVQVASIQTATGTPAITFAANGQMTLANTPLQLTGGQIVFPATQIPSADGNTLDDYEEGTWTPTLVFSGGAGTLSYSERTGLYTKIGRTVYFSMRLVFNKGTASGTLDNLTGLPFSATSANGGSVYIDGMNSLTGTCQYTAQGTTLYVYMSGTGNAGSIPAVSMGATNNVFMISGFYIV